MPLIERFTPGGNIYPDGSSTFSVLVQFFRRWAENRDAMDQQIASTAADGAIDAAAAEIATLQPETIVRGVVTDREPINPPIGFVWFEAQMPPTGIDAMDGLAARWDFTDLRGEDGSTITVLEPRNGSDYTAPLTAPGATPILRTGVVNGLPVGRFSAASLQYMEATIPATMTPLTVVSVVNVTAASSAIFSAGTTSAYVSLAITGTTPAFGAGSSGTGATNATNTWTPDSGWWIVVQVANGSDSRVYFRARTPKPWSTGTGAGFQSLFRIGRNSSTLYSTMDVGEYLLFNKALSDAEVQSVLTELAAKYSVPLGA